MAQKLSRALVLAENTWMDGRIYTVHMQIDNSTYSASTTGMYDVSSTLNMTLLLLLLFCWAEDLGLKQMIIFYYLFIIKLLTSLSNHQLIVKSKCQKTANPNFLMHTLIYSHCPTVQTQKIFNLLFL